MTPQGRWLFIALEAALIPAAWLLGTWLGVPPLAQFCWSPAGLAWGVLATVPLVAAALATRRMQLAPLRRIWWFVERQMRPLFRTWSWTQLVLVSAGAGIGEELLFRGVIQAALDERVGLPLAVLLTSLLFGALHALTWTYAAFAALVSIYLAGLWYATGNLLAPMTAHGLYDFLLLAYITRGWPAPVPPSTGT